MKRILSVLSLLLVLVFAVSVSSQASLSQFVGTWVNVARTGGELTHLTVQQNGAGLAIEVWGRAVPTDIDWGVAQAVAYGPNVTASANEVDAAMAVYGTNFKTSYVLLRTAGSRLTVETLTEFTDNSGRSSYHYVDTFERGALVRPNVPAMIAPTQLQPADGRIFRTYPRNTTLSWQAVAGAATYGVEVDYDTGQNNWVQWRNEQAIGTTSYTFPFVGAQPGRWRVWGIAADGTVGPSSPWRGFTYTR